MSAGGASVPCFSSAKTESATRTHQKCHSLADLDLALALDAAPGEVELGLHRDPPLGGLALVLRAEDLQLGAGEG